MSIVDSIKKFRTEESQYNIAKKLLEKNSDSRLTNELLIYGVDNNYLNIIKLALDYGADIHAFNEKALRNSVSYYLNYEKISFLLENGADINSLDKETINISFKDYDVVCLLLKYKININVFSLKNILEDIKILEEQIENCDCFYDHGCIHDYNKDYIEQYKKIYNLLMENGLKLSL